MFILIFIPLLAIAGIVGTKHDLSITGPGPVKAVSETQICVFCHTPHNAKPSYPLWNHEVTAVQNYINYWSPTLKSYPSRELAPPIDGFSRLCLSCHDGTVAIGAVIASPLRGGIVEDIEMVGVTGGKLRPDSPAYLGTDLSGGHPISIIFNDILVFRRNSETSFNHLNFPIRDRDVKLYRTQGGFNGVQCPSCHDPHGGKGGPGAPPFWRKTTFNEVCLVCHKDIEGTPSGFPEW